MTNKLEQDFIDANNSDYVNFCLGRGDINSPDLDKEYIEANKEEFERFVELSKIDSLEDTINNINLDQSVKIAKIMELMNMNPRLIEIPKEIKVTIEVKY